MRDRDICDSDGRSAPEPERSALSRSDEKNATSIVPNIPGNPDRLHAVGVYPETVRVPLPKRYHAIIDAEDAERILAFKWHLKRKSGSKRIYAQRTIRLGSGRSAPKSAVMLHRQVLNAQPGQIVDHINGNTLDNRKCNLRICTSRQNSENVAESANQRRGFYKGVYQPQRTWRWCAAISAGEKRPSGKRKRLHLGTFDTPEQAAEAYDLAALEHFGEFAGLNFPGKLNDYHEALSFKAAVRGPGSVPSELVVKGVRRG